ncbi:hypothetical protein [Streptomyces venezuelae]|uniref:hypothetical protein n=1 Tax=Streptomyces venezuelae TaxID=54571 RepID=UPI0037A47566
MQRKKRIGKSAGPWLHPVPWSIAILVVIVVVLSMTSSQSALMFQNTAQLAGQVLSLGACCVQCHRANRLPWRRNAN